MQTILLVAQSIGLAIGGLVGADALCWLLWQTGKLLRHPDWAAMVVVFLAGLAITGNLPRSDLLDMSLTFLAAAIIPLWLEGRTWRRGRHARDDRQDGALAKSAQTIASRQRNTGPYPAISACLCSGMPPNRDEIRLVATRIWREAFQSRSESQTPSFAIRRILIRAAKAALTGSQLPVTRHQSAF